MIEQNTPCISIPDVLTSNTVEQNENISEDGEDEDFEGELINAHASVSSDITDAASELSKLKTTYRQRYKAAWELEHLFKGKFDRMSRACYIASCRNWARSSETGQSFSFACVIPKIRLVL